MSRVVLFGDPQGVPQLLRCLEEGTEVLAIVQASTRPGQGADLRALAAGATAPLLLQPSWREASYPEFVDALRALEPDLFLINSYSMILRTEVLEIPTRGTVNIHGALLPSYRGANVTEWALINEERTSGVTVHVVDGDIDTGPIIAQATVPLNFSDTWVDARQRINEATRMLLAEKMPCVLAGYYSAIPQGEGRRWPRRAAKDGCFEWSRPLRQIYNLVRALVAPHPGAFWENPDGTKGRLDRWTSLGELAALKGAYMAEWRYDGMSLLPKAPAPEEQRAVANASIGFDVLDASGAIIGAALLRDIDCYGGSARSELRGCGAAADQAVAALELFLRDELRIARLDAVEVIC